MISLEEAKVLNSSNATIGEFEKVDVDNDGFVHPAEFDVSLGLIIKLINNPRVAFVNTLSQSCELCGTVMYCVFRVNI